MNTRTVITPEDARKLADYITGLTLPFTLTWREGAGRSLSQNALFHKWMGQIAKATYDTPDNVKADCHIRWGIPIFRGEDADYNEFIVAALAAERGGMSKI